IKHLHENLGITVVYVTHDQSEALTMSDRVAVFNDGVIQQLAPPDALYERPDNSFVAQFIGENNKLPAKVTGRSGDVAHVRFANGTEGRATAVNCGDTGQETLVSIRPERVQVGVSDLANHTDARVLELIYLGDHIRCRMDVHGNDQFIVKLPNGAGASPLTVGETTRVGWAPEDARALDPI
ncbi:MAG: ABC transporter ATP-binding protein, partial [Pseudomonadota bacterium]